MAGRTDLSSISPGAPVKWDALDMELFLLAGDSEPRARGSRRRLISRMKGKDWMQASPQHDAVFVISDLRQDWKFSRRERKCRWYKERLTLDS
jgi:hypothetical protein